MSERNSVGSAKHIAVFACSLLVVFSCGAGTWLLTWSPNPTLESVTNYNVYYGTEEVQFVNSVPVGNTNRVLLSTFPHSILTSHVGMPPDTLGLPIVLLTEESLLYEFAVTAQNRIGESSFSSSVTITNLTRPKGIYVTDNNVSLGFIDTPTNFTVSVSSDFIEWWDVYEMNVLDTNLFPSWFYWVNTNTFEQRYWRLVPKE